MDTDELVLETFSAEETRQSGVCLARVLRAGDVIALSGDLGSGKTTFTQGLASGLGITASVTSPTFVLINQYRAPNGRVLQHVDCYRLTNAPVEMWDVGLTDLYEGDDIVVIEWADRIPGLLPAQYLEVAFDYLDETRRHLHLIAHGERPAQICATLAAKSRVDAGAESWGVASAKFRVVAGAESRVAESRALGGVGSAAGRISPLQSCDGTI